jgi:hypothetical protein
MTLSAVVSDGTVFENSGALPGYGPGAAKEAPKSLGDLLKLPGTRNSGPPPDPEEERRTFIDDVIDSLTGEGARREKAEKERKEYLDRVTGKTVKKPSQFIDRDVPAFAQSLAFIQAKKQFTGIQTTIP